MTKRHKVVTALMGLWVLGFASLSAGCCFLPMSYGKEKLARNQEIASISPLHVSTIIQSRRAHTTKLTLWQLEDPLFMLRGVSQITNA